LDVGCGAQPFRDLVLVGSEYIGIDTVDARDHFGYEVPGTRYFSGSTWPVEDGSVDLVICTEVMEHVLEPKNLLAEAYRTLRPGGRLLLTVPFAARWHFIPYDYWRYTPSGLQFLLETAGFESVAVYGRGNETTVACYKVMALMLPFLYPTAQGRGAALIRRALGLFMAPFFVCLAIISNLSLRYSQGGDDCLGYTSIATKPLKTSDLPLHDN